MTFIARATNAFAPADPAINAFSDLTIRLLPWGWWPADPPGRRQSWLPSHHAVYGAWLVSTTGYWIWSDRRDPAPERTAGTVVGALVFATSWALAAGAWDRRAARLRRRPWRR